MLQSNGNAIYEPMTTTYTSGGSGTYTPLYQDKTDTSFLTTTPYYYLNSYPVYVCMDKTKKAIDVLKALQDEKLLECKSVSKFIALVEKIANLL